MDENNRPFRITARRCRRCGGLLTSEQGITDGIGHTCKRKEQHKQQVNGQLSWLNHKEGGLDNGDDHEEE